MGLILQTAIIPNCKEDVVKAALAKVAVQDSNFELEIDGCQYHEINGGVNVLFNDGCSGFESMAEAISEALNQCVLLLYIYDEDYWGYYLYEGGKELDCFNPIPDYFEEVSEEEYQRCKGNSTVISKYFDVEAESIDHYLVAWTDEMEEGKAYDDDEFEQGDCWQMADFMNKIGYPYTW